MRYSLMNCPGGTSGRGTGSDRNGLALSSLSMVLRDVCAGRRLAENLNARLLGSDRARLTSLPGSPSQHDRPRVDEGSVRIRGCWIVRSGRTNRPWSNHEGILKVSVATPQNEINNECKLVTTTRG